MGEQKVKTISGAPDSKQAAKPRARSKKKRSVPRGRIYIQSTYNNTKVTFTDEKGGVIAWSSAGLVGFKGSKKSTPYAAQRTMEEALNAIKPFGLKEVSIFIKGIGSGRESAVRALQGSGMTVLSIHDTTPIPHGGVRPRKPRRQ